MSARVARVRITWSDRGAAAQSRDHETSEPPRRPIVLSLLGLLLWSISIIAFAPGASAQDQHASRVDCSDAGDDFVLFCLAYKTITTEFVHTVVVADLAEAAKKGVIAANLAATTTSAPPCALPSPEFEDVCAEIDKAQDTTAAALAATDAMLASLKNRWTYRLNPNQLNVVESGLSSNIQRIGIGIEQALLNTDGEPCDVPSSTCRMVILNVYAGSPAESAGLKAGDVLVSYGKVISDHTCNALVGLDYGYGLNEAVSVTVLRNGANVDIDLVAAPVTDPVVFSQMVDSNVGYIRLDLFSQGSSRTFSEHTARLIQDGAKAIVVDLRGNRGGYGSETENIASVFLKKMKTIYRVFSTHVDRTSTTSADGIASDAVALPMVVAVNGRSASASELFALAMRGNGRAKIVGTPTYGKHSGQITRTAYASDGTVLGAIQATTLLFFGPGGISSQGGIQPDVTASISNCSHPLGVVRKVVPSLYPRVRDISITSSPAATAYRPGEKITVAVTFDAPIIVDTSQGRVLPNTTKVSFDPPSVGLQVGSNIRQAEYKSTTTTGVTSVIEFEYTVDSDTDDDGVSIAANSLNLNGATIRRTGIGWDAILDHSVVQADSQHVVSARSEPVTPEPETRPPPVDSPPTATQPTPPVQTPPPPPPVQTPPPIQTPPPLESPPRETQTPPENSAGQAENEVEGEPKIAAESGTDETERSDDTDDTEDTEANEAEQPETSESDQAGADEAAVSTDRPDSDQTPTIEEPKDDSETHTDQTAPNTEPVFDPQEHDPERFFSDISDTPFVEAINRLRQAEITTGCADDKYCPNQPVTRGQMAAFLYRARDLIEAARRQDP